MPKHIATGPTVTLGIKYDGTVTGTGVMDGISRLNEWQDIVSIDAGVSHVIGLKSDGTLLSLGHNALMQGEVHLWRNITEISAGSFHAVGLAADGTVVATGNNIQGQCNVEKLSGIVRVFAGSDCTVCLTSSGTIEVIGGRSSSSWGLSAFNGIVDIGVGDRYIVGLREDGTVDSNGANEDGQCNVQGWKNIVQIAVGSYHTVGLKSDGTVVATGRNRNGQCDTTEWTDVVEVSASTAHTVGLRADGSVVAKGTKDHAMCNVTHWTGIGFSQDGAGVNKIPKLKSSSIRSTGEHAINEIEELRKHFLNKGAEVFYNNRLAANIVSDIFAKDKRNSRTLSILINENVLPELAGIKKSEDSHQKQSLLRLTRQFNESIGIEKSRVVDALYILALTVGIEASAAECLYGSELCNLEE